MDISQEQGIVASIKDDPTQFGLLFDAYYTPIYSYVLRRTADPFVAQDIVAETFLKAYQNIGSFKWKGISVANWLYKIATNELRMYFRKNAYTPQSLEQLQEVGGFEPISDEDLHAELIAAQTALERQQQFVDAQRILITLPIKYQEVITLRFVEKKKLSEIAAILDKREGTVKSLLSRGLAKLRTGIESSKMQPITPPGIVHIEGQLLAQPQGFYEE